MSESKEVRTLRVMSWQRAKGELLAYLETFWPTYKADGSQVNNGFEAASKRIKDFIKDFEENHL